MKGLLTALYTELLKVRKSKIFWITILIFIFIAAMMGLMVFLAKHPNLVSSTELIGAKASMFNMVNWVSYFNMLHQVVAMVGLIGFGFAFSWIFGREYSDKTIKDLLALPVSRNTLVLAKYIISIIWSALLSLVFFITAIAAGILVHIEGWSLAETSKAIGIYAGTSMLTILLCTPVAFFASWGRGFLLSLGFLILIMITTQFIGLGIPSFAPYFPWAVPAFYCGAAGPENSSLGALSYILLCLTSLSGVAGTLAWWRYADHT